MRKTYAIFLAILLITPTVLAFAKPPAPKDEGPPYTDARGNSRWVELQNKDENWDPIIGDGRWGWLHYVEKMSACTFEGNLNVQGMESNSWYLVTLWTDDADSDTATNLGSVGYMGLDPKTQHADIGFFKTNNKGRATVDLPYAEPGLWDPGWDQYLTAPTLPSGMYRDVKVHVKYVGTGDTPDWGLVLNGGYVVGGDPDALDYNLYEMALIDFDVYCKVTLENKVPYDWTVIEDDMYGELLYMNGPEFNYEFKGYGLVQEAEYCLIYYADLGELPNYSPWVYETTCIGCGYTDASGKLSLKDSVDLNKDLPIVGDQNPGAKMWLVPSTIYDCSSERFTSWDATVILFETELITYDDTDWEVPTLYMVAKNMGTWAWEPERGEGWLKYNEEGPRFNYEFEGTVPIPDIQWSLIYYKDPYATHLVIEIWNGYADGGGYLSFKGSTELNTDLPVAGDSNPEAKLWLIPTANLLANQKMSFHSPYQMVNFLWETEHITYNDTDVP